MNEIIQITASNWGYHFQVDLRGTAPEIAFKVGSLKDLHYHLTDEALESLKTNPNALPPSLHKKKIYPIAIAPLDDKRIVVVHFDQQIKQLKAIKINYAKGYFGEIEDEKCFPALQDVQLPSGLVKTISFRAGQILTPTNFIFKNESNLFFINHKRSVVLADPSTGEFKAEVNFFGTVRGMALDADGNIRILVRNQGGFSLYKFSEQELINIFKSTDDISKHSHMVLTDIPDASYQMCFLKSFDFALSTYNAQSKTDVIYCYDKKARPIDSRMMRDDHAFIVLANTESQGYNIQFEEDKTIPYEVINYHHLKNAIENIPRIKKLLIDFQEKMDREPNDKYKVLAQKLHDRLARQVNDFENNIQLTSDAYGALEDNLKKTIRVALPEFNKSPTWRGFILNFFKAISNSVMSAFGYSEESHYTLFRPSIKKTIDELKDLAHKASTT